MPAATYRRTAARASSCVPCARFWPTKRRFPPRQTASVLAALRRTLEPPDQPPAAQGEGDLTNREREVLALIVQGESNDEISRTLTVSLYTVKSHVRSILTKLNVENRREAAKVAVQTAVLSAARATGSSDNGAPKDPARS